MQNMVFNGLLFLVFLYVVVFSVYVFIQIMKYLEEKQKIKKMEIENTKMDLMMKMDPKIAETEIEALIKKYVQEYSFTNFVMKQIIYIREDQVEEMVRYLDKQIIMEISELYIFYIKIIINITDEDDLLLYIDRKVRSEVLEFITDFNKTELN